jgi:cation diffusion facilitator CzcD-associated flavoprotein CzcO
MSTPPEHFDVLIIGAGLSGIGAACHLTTDCPGKTFAVLEARATSGGTWDLFRYPGVRSDSDMSTLGYGFRPWRGTNSIADGGSILGYLRDTAREYGVEAKIRYRHRVVHAAWSSATARWTLDVQRQDPDGELETVQLTCGFLFGNTGYYRYDQGFTPEFPGAERFTGTIVHPQLWPEDLDYAGRRVVVIGSGATAVTLVPAMAERAAHVTMLQRSPSYIVSLSAQDAFADLVQRHLPPRFAAPLARWKNVLLTALSYLLSRQAPTVMKALIRKGVARQLPADFAIDTHFAPRYLPWDQRLCVVPDGDLFAAIRNKTASVVTDQIETFTERGIRLRSGTELEADVIVTATGLNVLMAGGISLEVDGRAVDFAQTVGYKGLMFSGVPNLALTIGYTNASWTLKADLAAGYVCRLLNLMDARGYRQCTPLGPDPALPTRPFLGLTSGYVTRALDAMPRQGVTKPWRLHQNYASDLIMMRYGKIEDDVLQLS